MESLAWQIVFVFSLASGKQGWLAQANGKHAAYLSVEPVQLGADGGCIREFQVVVVVSFHSI